MNHFAIRMARPGDEARLAEVHIKAWQEAYAGMISKEYLDHLSDEIDSRISMWKSILANPKRWAWVAESQNTIVGFILFGPPRDSEKENYIELGAIYLLAAEKNKRIGFNLLSAGFHKMRDLGYKKAYCWVLENNPTIKFYEKTGAKFLNQIKQDEIGGKPFNELAFEWDSLLIGDYPWEALSLEEINKLFSGFHANWIIAGGWAIDLFLKKQTREHSDVDVLIARHDQSALQVLLKEWELWVADPPGVLRPWKPDEFLDVGIQDIWVRKNSTDPWRFQIMLFDSDDDFWIYKRNPSIRMKINELFLQNTDGLKYLKPEIQLLHKSKNIREKDQLDFENTKRNLSSEQIEWLIDKLSICYHGQHQWLNELSNN